MYDFTLASYQSLCEFLLSENYEFLTVKDIISRKELPEKFICMRHDVDRLPMNALSMAKIEAKLGIRSTYYFRVKKFIFNKPIITKVDSLSHEVGYHYEVLSDASGNLENAKQLFQGNLEKFKDICKSVETVCMHGAPLSAHDNIDFWKHFKLSDFNLLGEPYLSIDYDELNMKYFTDTGRSWGDRGVNLRDHAGKSFDKSNIHSTQDLINLLKSDKLTRVMIQTHPERWAFNKKRYFFSILWDFSTNMVKRVIKVLRKSNV